MRCRTLAPSASLALVLLLSWSVARADDPAPPASSSHARTTASATPKLPAPTQVTVDVGSFRLGQAAERAELGTLWSRIVAATVGTLRSLAALHHHRVAAAGEAMRPAKAAPPPRLSWQRDVGSSARRKEPARAQRVRPTPVAADASIATEAREQHAILLGAEMSLPWQVP